MKDIVGRNIREIRKKHKISVRKLAGKLNITASFLSQVETGKAHPSLTNLKNIAEMLNVGIADLLGEKKNEPDSRERVVFKKKGIISLKKTKGLQVHLLSTKNIVNHMQPYTITFDVGVDTGDFSRHFGQECGFVIKGKIKFFLDDEEYVLEEGDNFYYNSSIPHRFENIDHRISKVFFVASPPIF